MFNLHLIVLLQKKVPPALPARGNSQITTVPTPPPKNKALNNLETTSLSDTKQTSIEVSTKGKCDKTEQQQLKSAENSGSPSPVVKPGENCDEEPTSNDKAKSAIDNKSGDIVSAKKIYQTEMI